MIKHRFGGPQNRDARKQRHLERAKQEAEEMLKNGESIKIDHWLDEDKPNQWLWIRVSFKAPIIPVNYKTDIRSVLSELFNEYL